MHHIFVSIFSYCKGGGNLPFIILRYIAVYSPPPSEFVNEHLLKKNKLLKQSMSYDIYFNIINVTKSLQITLFYYCSALENVVSSFHQSQRVQPLIHCDPKRAPSGSGKLQKTTLGRCHHQ